jgi:SulP family sulfate permease
MKYGGRGRLSTLIAGAFLMFLIIVLNNIVVQIPLAALVAVMIVVSISTFDWRSLTRLHKLPKTDAIVTVVTVVAVVITHNLAIGVILGIILSAVFFASKISKVQVTEVVHSSLQKMEYKIEGQLFFASVTDFLASFNFKQENITTVDIDLSNAQIWDESGVNAIDKVILKFHQNGIKTNIHGLNPASKTLLNRVTMFNKPGGLN